MQTNVQNLKAAMRGLAATEGFMAALSPNNLVLNHPSLYYRTEEEYLVALADAMREEYAAIVEAGLVLHIDDPRLATHYDRTPDATMEECRRFIAQAAEVVNYSIRDLPADRVRFHTCYSTNVAPRLHDLELKHFVDLMPQINAGGYSFEAANPGTSTSSRSGKT